jgi:hypothetical protein
MHDLLLSMTLCAFLFFWGCDPCICPPECDSADFTDNFTVKHSNWIDQLGTFSIVSGRMQTTDGTAVCSRCRTSTSLSGKTVRLKADVFVTGDAHATLGIAFGLSGILAAETFFFLGRVSAGVYNWRSVSPAGFNDYGAGASGDELRIDLVHVSGSNFDIEYYANGVLLGTDASQTLSDTFVIQLRTTNAGGSGTAEWDDLSYEII